MAGETDLKALERRVLWKLDCHVLPPLALLWLMNFLDRSNIGALCHPFSSIDRLDVTIYEGNARTAGLETDLHLHGTQFNTALAIFYVSYLVVELPSNWIMKKMKPSRWLPLLVGVWGFVTICTGFTQNYSGIIAIRFFLGLCEGGLLPGIILYLSTLYKRHELQLRVGIFYASASLSGAFGGLLASGIIKMNGLGVHDFSAGWRWIFFLEGLATILSAIVATIFLPADLSSAKFFTEEERDFAVSRFRLADGHVSSAAPPQTENNLTHSGDSEKALDAKVEQVIKPQVVHYEDERFEWREVMRGVCEIQVWLTGLAYFGLIVSLYSYSLFLPTIISGLGYSGSRLQLFTVPPYAPASVLTVIVAYFSDRLRWRGPFILIFLPLAIIGYILAIVAKTNSVRYGSFFLIAAGVYPSGPCILSILPNNSSGHYKKATTTALQLAVANIGAFVAVFTYTSDDKPRYIRGHSITLAFLCLAWVLIACNVAYCIWENRARAAGKRQGNLEKYQALWDQGLTRAPIGDRHPDFRFTL